jgi:uncharacterized membrane protein YdjX (TVP38/TMEM64 family)
VRGGKNGFPESKIEQLMKKSLKYLLLAAFVAIVVYILKFSPLSYYFFTEQGKQIFGEHFKTYLGGLGAWAPFIFIGCYTLSVVFFVPATVFTSLGAVVFGNWGGLVLNLIAANIGGALSFLTARYLLRDAAGKLLQKGRFKKLDDAAERHGFSILIYLRLMFVPFTYLNFAAGLSKMKFKDFFWSTFIGIIPGITVVTFLAAAVKKLLVTYKQPSDALRPDIILPLALFAFSFFIPTIIKHFRNKFYVTGEIEKEIK